MALISGSIPNLINGVSQQAPALRGETQADEQVNAYSSIVGGLRKRPPGEYVGVLPAGPNVFYHFVEKSNGDRFVVTVEPGADIKVTDIDTGEQRSVDAPSSTDYLTTDNPAADLRALDVSDTVFIVNRRKTVQMGLLTSDPLGSPRSHAIVPIKQAVSGQKYTIKVTSAGTGSTTVNFTATSDAKADITFELKELLLAALSSVWHVWHGGGAVYIRNDNGEDFTVEVEDDWSGDAISAIRDEVPTETDLPVPAIEGHRVRVADQNYWSIYRGEGVWEECPAPDTELTLEKATMPHRLVSLDDDTYSFEAIEWAERTAGGADDLAHPSFVGGQIREIFFLRNRLGLISDINVCMSASGDLFNFFRITGTDLLDEDRIDIEVAESGSAISHAVGYDGQLLLWSSSGQFILDGGDLLTPRTVAVKPTTSFSSSNHVRPVQAGQRIFFPFDRGSFSGVREYFADTEVERYDAADVTAHCPRYLPGPVKMMSATVNEDVMCALCEDDLKSIFVYKYFWSGNEKVQSSWSRYGFDSDIRGMSFLDSDLYVVLSDGVMIRLRSSDETVGPTNVDEVYLDRRLSVDDLDTAPSYDANTDETAFVLPYAVTEDCRLVADGASLAPGRIDGAEPNTLYIYGDHTEAESAWIGMKYEMRYRFSTAHVRERSRSGGVTAVGGSRLQVKRWRVTYDQTGYFRAEVQTTGRDTRTYEFTGRVFGSGNNVPNAPSISTGEFAFPVLAKNTEATVEIVNDSPLPSNFLSASWEAEFNPRSRRV